MDLVSDLRNYHITNFEICLFPNVLQFVGIKHFGKYIYLFIMLLYDLFAS
jgi:hypothetical protein